MGVDRILISSKSKSSSKELGVVKNGKKMVLSEGWIEFLDSEKAKAFVLMLNGHLICDEENSKYLNEIWNLKYLPKLDWNHISIEINVLRFTKEQKMIIDYSLVKRACDYYLKLPGKDGFNSRSCK